MFLNPLLQDPDAELVDDGGEDSWLDAKGRAETAFQAVLSNGTKIQGDHHLVFHTRTPSDLCACARTLNGTCRLRVWKAIGLPR